MRSFENLRAMIPWPDAGTICYDIFTIIILTRDKFVICFFLF